MRFLRNFLTGNEQRALLFVCAFGLLGMLLSQLGGEIPLAKAGEPPAQELSEAVKSDQPVQIDIRTASLEELTLLPGIGPKRAQDIIDYRSGRQFSSVRDLLEIKGIGEKTLARMLPSLLLFGAADQALAQSLASQPTEPLSVGLLASDTGGKTHSGKSSAKSGKNTAKPLAKSELNNIVNINTAGLEELCTLPGIGEVKARAIMDFRAQNGPFSTVEDITKVKGIGAKTLEKIRHRLSI